MINIDIVMLKYYINYLINKFYNLILVFRYHFNSFSISYFLVVVLFCISGCFYFYYILFYVICRGFWVHDRMSRNSQVDIFMFCIILLVFQISLKLGIYIIFLVHRQTTDREMSSKLGEDIINMYKPYTNYDADWKTTVISKQKF